MLIHTKPTQPCWFVCSNLDIKMLLEPHSSLQRQCCLAELQWRGQRQREEMLHSHDVIFTLKDDILSADTSYSLHLKNALQGL